jgi:hypothetical protein
VFPDRLTSSSELTSRIRHSLFKKNLGTARSNELLAKTLAAKWHSDCSIESQENKEMDAVVIMGALVGSFAGAFILQKAALEGLFRMMNADRRLKH